MTMRPGLLYFVAVDAYVRLLTMLITGTATPNHSVSWSALHASHCNSQHTFQFCPARCKLGHRLKWLPHGRFDWLAETRVCTQNCTLILLVLACKALAELRVYALLS